MFKHILFLLVTISLFTTSCRNSKNIQTDTISSHSIIKETVKDTTYIIEADSSNFSASLEVDSTGNIQVKNVVERKEGKRISSPSVKIKNNKLEVDCYSEAQKLFKEWKETHRFDSDTEIITNTVQVEKPIGSFVQFQIWSGRIAWIIVVVGLLGNYLKKSINPFKFR